MGNYKDLKTRLDQGDTIIHDAAVSTELHSMGVPMDFVAWSGPSNYTHPSSIIQMHERQIKAGADIITTNTWSTLRPTLERAGYGDFIREINARAVHLAQKARQRASVDRAIYVAGSLSSNITGRDPRTGEMGFPAFSSTPGISAEELRDHYREVTSIMAEAGVDFFIVESMGRDNEARIIQAEAAKETGLPVWIGFNAHVDPNDTVMLGGQQNPTYVAEGKSYPGARKLRDDMTLSEAIREVISVGPDVLSIFHSRIENVNRAVEIALEEWSGPLMAYPDAGATDSLIKWRDLTKANEESTEEYIDAAKAWVNQGVQIVGTCCGFGVEYIKPLRQSIPQKI
ncbi:homocysteine S-methyltransferase family protein [Chloroflexi bacterium]|nr:homocysteine S-methyltransferase family protein [Chloroflexota bacterium]